MISTNSYAFANIIRSLNIFIGVRYRQGMYAFNNMEWVSLIDDVYTFTELRIIWMEWIFAS